MIPFDNKHGCLIARYVLSALMTFLTASGWGNRLFAENASRPNVLSLAPADKAEALLQAALDRELSDVQVDQAAELLTSADPFERGMAWWALAVKVGMDNEGFAVAWPKADPPAWFVKWAEVPLSFQVEADNVRQLVTFGLHRKKTGILFAADKTLKRAETIAGLNPAQPDLVPLRSLHQKLAGQVKSSTTLKECRATYIFNSAWPRARSF